MIFNSIPFILYFLPVFLLVYYIANPEYKNVVLFAGSMVFYAYGEPWYILLLLSCICLAYFTGKAISPEKNVSRKKKKALYLLALFVQVFLLLIFKCAPLLFRLSGFGVALPLGISFYTFQILSYLTDVYLGRCEGERNFVNLAVYVSMFPKISAGPIAGYGEMAGEMKNRKITGTGFDEGLKTFLYGLILKVLLADRLAILWHEIQTAGYISISTPLAWMGAYSYSMQLYFDFYGYSLMAIGLGRMLGFSLPDNFKDPYMSKSVREFYRRWHMTLGKWFTKYVYIPLGGSRKGVFATIRNLVLVWLLTAFWHGAGLNFFIWGLALCTFIILERAIDRKKRLDKSHVIGHVYVLFVIPLTWICFAISDFSELQVYFGRLFGLIQGTNIKAGDYIQALKNYGGYLLAGCFFCTPLAGKLYHKCKNNIFGMFVLAILFWICIDCILKAGNNPFMYLRF